MNHDKQLALIKLYIEKMPSLPTTVTKILEVCNDPQISPADLNRIISVDPVLMGKVLKLINSAYYGLSQEVTSLVRAIIMLGINTVKNLALSTAVLATVGRNSNFQALNMDGFWRHSLCTGVTGRLIAKKRKIDSKILEEYFIAGLLHDIGKIPLNNRLSEDYLTAMGESDIRHSPLHVSEREVFGIDHTNVGHMILQTWKLDEAIRDAVLFHHTPLDYSGNHIDIVYSTACANYFSNFFEIGFSGDRYPEKLPPEVFRHLGVSMEFMEEIDETVQQEIEKASIFLKLSNTQ